MEKQIVEQVHDETEQSPDNNGLEPVEHVFVERDRRKFPRRAARFSTSITLANKKRLSGRTRDVSERGVSVLLPVNLKPESLVIIELLISYRDIHKRVKFLGIVKHRSSVSVDGYTVGIQIKDAPDAVTTFFSAFANKEL